MSRRNAASKHAKIVRHSELVAQGADNWAAFLGSRRFPSQSSYAGPSAPSVNAHERTRRVFERMGRKPGREESRPSKKVA